MLFKDPVDISSDESSPSDAEDTASFKFSPQEVTFRKAKMYQDYMKENLIPTNRSSVIPFTLWTGLAKSLKQLYFQPLHYLTNITLRQWDRVRADSKDEFKPLDTIVHPYKASIWLMEELHRLTTSSHYLSLIPVIMLLSIQFYPNQADTRLSP